MEKDKTSKYYTTSYDNLLNKYINSHINNKIKDPKRHCQPIFRTLKEGYASLYNMWNTKPEKV